MRKIFIIIFNYKLLKIKANQIIINTKLIKIIFVYNIYLIVKNVIVIGWNNIMKNIIVNFL